MPDENIDDRLARFRGAAPGLTQRLTPDSFDSHRSQTVAQAVEVFRRELEDEDAHIEDAVRAAALYAYTEARAASTGERKPAPNMGLSGNLHIKSDGLVAEAFRDAKNEDRTGSL